jgi:molybdenum cofactor guanylyltransferase
MTRILGVIVAGGLSTRMGGREKSFIELGGASLLERILSRIRFQVEDIAINAKGDLSRFASARIHVFPDLLPDLNTPLAGIHAGLAQGHARGFDAVLTVPSDAPFLPLDLVKRLEEEGRSTGAAVAASMGQTHYLTGLWSTALAPVLDGYIRNEGMRRVQDFVSRLHAEEVEWEALPHDPFLNVNTPEELAIAERVLAP